MSKQPYSFCFLRYHHDMIAGEFGNIGVLLWAPDGQYLGFRCTSKYSRLSKFFLDFSPEDYRSLVSRLTTQFAKLADEYAKDKYLPAILEKPKSARDLALKVIPEDDGALRWSKSQGGLVESPELELEAIFQRFIESKNFVQQSERRDDKAVYEAKYKPVFQDAVIKPVMKPHYVEAALDEYQFHDAWQNGCWNVYETLSFDYADIESMRNKALRWDSRVRHLSASEERPLIHLLLGNARDEHRKAFGKAKDILSSSHQETNVRLVFEDEVNDFQKDLRQKVKDHLAESRS